VRFSALVRRSRKSCIAIRTLFVISSILRSAPILLRGPCAHVRKLYGDEFKGCFDIGLERVARILVVHRVEAVEAMDEFVMREPGGRAPQGPELRAELARRDMLEAQLLAHRLADDLDHLQRLELLRPADGD